MKLAVAHLIEAFELTAELAATLDSQRLQARNGAARSNSVGAQFWCIVGARESYARAIEAGAWAGFACSLQEPHSPESVADALAGSSAALQTVLDRLGELSEAQEDLLLRLLEHECQHHGQLIRYFYANGFPFPAAFAKRYSLS